MRIILLGSGSYSGTPKPFCGCENCTRARRFPIYRRTRFSLYLGKLKAIVDPSPDLHYHLEHLNEKVEQVLITHPHFDHIAGVPELQIFEKLTFYSHEETLRVVKWLQEAFVGEKRWEHVSLSFGEWKSFGNFNVLHFRTPHKPGDVAGGFVIEIGGKKIGITGDTGPEILKDEKTLESLTDLDLLVVEMTHRESIPGTHLGVEDALRLVELTKPELAVFAHISHNNYPHEILERKVMERGIRGIVGRDFLHLDI
ncbi:MBL fold metallo-hydrolase [Pyrococcus yayanosii]|uniref:Metallo-beta-lactamase superfamily protein n=1 Tax=Pyrococcus yayanosii (strain CH1 / JCM 16557) TaxID=529709 RepID=F8AIV8_PYRYC|nr:MBL fold metallo-hydrolase [Pyrococcus yayanosii]AEH24433.1 metallo-beta-lactamase superfamily protein [Pyrococcus yayanosii CH1]